MPLIHDTRLWYRHRIGLIIDFWHIWDEYLTDLYLIRLKLTPPPPMRFLPFRPLPPIPHDSCGSWHLCICRSLGPFFSSKAFLKGTLSWVMNGNVMWIGADFAITIFRSQKPVVICMLLFRVWQGPGGYSQKNLVGCATRFPKPLPYLWPKSAIFSTISKTWPKISYPVYDLTLRWLGERLLQLSLSSMRSRR